MTDLITQAINEAKDARQFSEAAALVENHIKTNRDPDLNAGLVAHLSYRGHHLTRLMSRTYGESDPAYVAYAAAYISGSVVRILNLEVKAHNGTQRP